MHLLICLFDLLLKQWLFNTFISLRPLLLLVSQDILLHNLPIFIFLFLRLGFFCILNNFELLHFIFLLTSLLSLLFPIVHFSTSLGEFLGFFFLLFFFFFMAVNPNSACGSLHVLFDISINFHKCMCILKYHSLKREGTYPYCDIFFWTLNKNNYSNNLYIPINHS